MNFLRSRSEHLVAHLRDCIARGELANPLPNTRAWSQKLGVSRVTLIRALQVLQQEGVLEVQPRRGAVIRKDHLAQRTKPARFPRLVRSLYYGPDYPHLTEHLDWFIQLSEQLQNHEIHLTLERCHDARLRAISQRGERPHEMVILHSLPVAAQRLFADWKRSALLFGRPAPGVRLPFVAMDLPEMVRHATLTLLQHGHPRLSLLTGQAGSPGLQQVTVTFEATCREWKRSAVQAEVVSVPLGLEPMVAIVRRLALRIQPPQGLIVIAPVSLGVVMSALLGRGFKFPGQVEVIAVESSLATVKACPSIGHYPLPVDQVVKLLAEAALHFFESGSVPRLRRSLLVERIPASKVVPHGLLG